MAKSRFLQIAHDYTWLNPHLSLEISWDGERQGIEATNPGWRKWLPSDPTPAQWYDVERFERLAGAHVADDQDQQRNRTVREFIADFRGMSSTKKQRAVLEATGMSRMALADLFPGGAADRASIARLLAAAKDATKPVRPQDSASSARNISRRSLLPPALTLKPSTTRKPCATTKVFRR